VFLWRGLPGIEYLILLYLSSFGVTKVVLNENY